MFHKYINRPLCSVMWTCLDVLWQHQSTGSHDAFDQCQPVWTQHSYSMNAAAQEVGSPFYALCLNNVECQ